jgi:hypothetical protein
MNEHHISLDQLPPLYLMLIKSGVARKSGFAEFAGIPPLRLDARIPVATSARINAYKKFIDWPGPELIPLPFFYLIAQPAQLALMCSPAFPFRIPGLVHLANRLHVVQMPKRSSDWRVHVSVGKQRISRKGGRFLLLTEVIQGDDLLCHVESTYFSPAGAETSFGKNIPKGEARMNAFSNSAEFVCAADLGRRYARLSGDYNPIHLSPFLAKLYGFNRPIAPGMCSAALSLSTITRHVARVPVALEVKFRRPLFLPSQAKINFETDRKESRFVVHSPDFPEPHILGQVTFE